MSAMVSLIKWFLENPRCKAYRWCLRKGEQAPLTGLQLKDSDQPRLTSFSCDKHRAMVTRVTENGAGKIIAIHISQRNFRGALLEPSLAYHSSEYMPEPHDIADRHSSESQQRVRRLLARYAAGAAFGVLASLGLLGLAVLLGFVLR